MQRPTAPEAVATHEGPLVLADISGYTTFVAATELEHSQYLITLLLEELIESMRGRLEPSQIEGDAVFFVGDGLPRELVGWFEDAYVAFHRKLRDTLSHATCTCQACARGPSLTLKVIAHHGRYFRQRVGPAEHLHGVDVIVPHRLAKNAVPSHEYVLVTRALLDRLPERERERFTIIDEDVAELGPQRVGYFELGPLRARLT